MFKPMDYNDVKAIINSGQNIRNAVWDNISTDVIKAISRKNVIIFAQLIHKSLQQGFFSGCTAKKLEITQFIKKKSKTEKQIYRPKSVLSV